MRRLFIVMALLALAACGNDKAGDNAGDNADDTASTTATTTPSRVTTTTTATAAAFGNTDVSTPEGTEQGALVNVTVGAHDGFVRVVFTFGNLVPGYSVKKADPPFVQDGSGAEVHVAGNGHLAVRLTARAHDEQGGSTAPAKVAGPQNTSVEEVVRTGDFEGVVNYVIGTTEPRGFKVLKLAAPARLVVDVQSP